MSKKGAQETIRYCCRCGQPLTDPVSKQHGIGPICRGLDNRVLAQQLEPDVPRARRCWLDRRAKFGSVPKEAQEALAQVEDALLGLDRTSRQAPRTDWRDVLRNCEYLLSWGCAGGVLQQTLYQIAEDLGYEALVALWQGDVVKGEAHLSFLPEEGALLLVAPRPRSRALKEELREHGFYDRRGPDQDAGWKFALSEAEWLQRFVRRSYLRIDPEYANVCSQAIAYREEHPDVKPVRLNGRASKGTTSVSIEVEHERNELIIRSPYNPEYIEAFKALFEDWRDRRWDGQAKVWIVKGTDWANDVRDLARKYFDQVYVSR